MMVTGAVKNPKPVQELVYNPDPKVLLIDADSILYIANYGNEECLAEGEFVAKEIIQDIITTVEQYFNIVGTMVFLKGEDNFRYKVDATYKANRKEKHPNIQLLHDYINAEFNTVIANGGEADDYIYTAWRVAEGNAVVASIDKDLKSFCYGDFYNYKTKLFSKVTEEESVYNFRIQLLMGDTGDGVNKTKGFGIQSAKKVVKMGMSEIAFKKELIKVYKKYHGNNYKDVVKTVYNLLCLHHVNDLNVLNIEYGRTRKERETEDSQP